MSTDFEGQKFGQGITDDVPLFLSVGGLIWLIWKIPWLVAIIIWKPIHSSLPWWRKEIKLIDWLLCVRFSARQLVLLVLFDLYNEWLIWPVLTSIYKWHISKGCLLFPRSLLWSDRCSLSFLVVIQLLFQNHWHSFDELYRLWNL